jgi:hypothetical protein
LRRALILAVIGFVLVLIVRFPARWASPLLPRGLQCRQLEGSAWHGSCSGLTNGGAPVGDLDWDLQALQLLRGRLALQLNLTSPVGFLRGELAFGLGGALHGRNLFIDLPLTGNLVSSFPAGARAHLTGRLTHLEWTGKYVSALEGEINVQDLVSAGGEALGDYQATFLPDAAGSDTPTGAVRDGGGPLVLQATLQLTHDPGYVLQGNVAARPTASSGLADSIKYLGSPDAAGLRHFALQGTF